MDLILSHVDDCSIRQLSDLIRILNEKISEKKRFKIMNKDIKELTARLKEAGVSDRHIQKECLCRMFAYGAIKTEDELYSKLSQVK